MLNLYFFVTTCHSHCSFWQRQDIKYYTYIHTHREKVAFQILFAWAATFLIIIFLAKTFLQRIHCCCCHCLQLHQSASVCCCQRVQLCQRYYTTASAFALCLVPAALLSSCTAKLLLGNNSSLWIVAGEWRSVCVTCCKNYCKCCKIKVLLLDVIVRAVQVTLTIGHQQYIVAVV